MLSKEETAKTLYALIALEMRDMGFMTKMKFASVYKDTPSFDRLPPDVQAVFTRVADSFLKRVIADARKAKG